MTRHVHRRPSNVLRDFTIQLLPVLLYFSRPSLHIALARSSPHAGLSLSPAWHARQPSDKVYQLRSALLEHAIPSPPDATPATQPCQATQPSASQTSRWACRTRPPRWHTCSTQTRTAYVQTQRPRAPDLTTASMRYVRRPTASLNVYECLRRWQTSELTSLPVL